MEIHALRLHPHQDLKVELDTFAPVILSLAFR